MLPIFVTMPAVEFARQPSLLPLAQPEALLQICRRELDKIVNRHSTPVREWFLQPLELTLC